MNQGNLSRRGFLQRSLAGLLAAGLPAWYAREMLAAEAALAPPEKKLSPNDALLMGAIGIGSPQSRGKAIYAAAKKHPGVRYVAACDVDGRHLNKALEFMKRDGSSEAAGYKDFRELLDRKDINAVTIATPDHWHTLIALDALRKGKDVYCEKPLTLTIDEGKALVKVARAAGRVFQVGSQQRSDGRFRLACELVRNGRLGKIQRVETRIGENPQGGPFPVQKPPKELDWAFWLGQAPMVEYVEPRCHYEFRWWYEYSGGKMTDWGAHHNDIAQWGLGMDGSGPVAVEAQGEKPSTDPHSYNCHRNFKITYTYANGARLVCSSHQLEGALDPKKNQAGKSHDNGVLFVGDNDKWIFVSREIIEASDKKLIDEPLPANAERLYVSNDHMGNFLECLKTHKKPICDVEIGHRSVTVCHLGTIALRSGKKLKWDPARQEFAGDSEANQWLRREMRAPWKLEV
jgi:predicted dehydrogenase